MNWKNHNFWPKSCFISEMIQNRVVIIMEHQQELQARSQGGRWARTHPPPRQTKMVRVVEYLIITVSPQERLSPPFPVYHLTLKYCLTERPDQLLIVCSLKLNQNQINQKAFIVSSTVIKIHSNHGNIRHNRNKWKQKAYRYLLPITNFNLGILINSKNIRNIRTHNRETSSCYDDTNRQWNYRI